MTPKQWRVDFAFIPINKEEREMDIEREYAGLREQGAECNLLWRVNIVGA